MHNKYPIAISVVLMGALFAPPARCHGQSAPGNLPVSISIYDPTRVDAWQWFAAPPQSETYGYVESLLRLGVAQKLQNWDWELEISQPAVLGLPDDAVSPLSAQGQLGLGGTYYVSNSNSANPAAAFLKQGFLRYHFKEGSNLQFGPFEFMGGAGDSSSECHRQLAADQSYCPTAGGQFWLCQCPTQL